MDIFGSWPFIRKIFLIRAEVRPDRPNGFALPSYTQRLHFPGHQTTGTPHQIYCVHRRRSGCRKARNSRQKEKHSRKSHCERSARVAKTRRATANPSVRASSGPPKSGTLLRATLSQKVSLFLSVLQKATCRSPRNVNHRMWSYLVIVTFYSTQASIPYGAL